MMFASILQHNPSLKFVYFDMCQDTRCITAQREIKKKFPNLDITVTAGDSTVTVPKYTQEHAGTTSCDFISIDGGHFADIPRKDIANMKFLAHDKTIVVIDDVGLNSDREYERVVGKAWFNAVEGGTIKTEGCSPCMDVSLYPESEKRCNFCVGRYVLHGM